MMLNGASPTLRFEVLSENPVFRRDPDGRAAFAFLTAREYEDEMTVLQQGANTMPVLWKMVMKVDP